MKGARSAGERPMRVLFFDHTAVMSGGEIALLHLVQHLDRTAFYPVVLLGAEGKLGDILRSSTEVHVLQVDSSIAEARKDALGAKSFLRLTAIFRSVSYIFRLARFIRSHDIDLVYTNSLKADVLGGLAARLTFTPVLWHVRDRIAKDYLPPSVVKTFLWMSRLIPSAIIANSHATASTLTRSQAKHKPLYVVHDGVPLHLFAPLPNSATEKRQAMVGIVGRISPWKGQDIFLRAADLVRRAYPDTRFRIIGSALFAEFDYEASLHALAAELQLGDALEFRGFRDDVPAEIRQLDIAVHASTRPEPFGQIIIEAMASGVPVVAVHAGGVPEIVQDGITGILVPINEVAPLASAVCSLLANPGDSRAMGLRGMQAAREGFSIQKTVSEVQDVFREVLRNESRSSLSRHSAPEISGV